MTEFKDYIEHGWSLAPILPGHKGPRKLGWNKKENTLTKPEQVVGLRGAGLAHAYSGTCAIDVDDYAQAHGWLQERGVDLDALFAAPDAIQISSGRAGHGKLLYKLPEPMCSKQIKIDKSAIIDFRCATAAGLTIQDVLPPSIHPDTMQPYKWVYDEMLCDWRDLPDIPAELLAIWTAEVDKPYTKDDVPEKGASTDELTVLLQQHDPNMSRDEWVRVGMACHHETDGGSEGLDVWDTWSRESDKYVGRHDLETVWRSFHDTPYAVTVGMLRQGTAASVDDFSEVDPTVAVDDPWMAAAQKRRERFRLVPVDEISKRDPPEWLVDKLVPKEELAMMFGPPGAGKSFMALDLAFAVAGGYTWFNRKTVAGPVAWLAAEAAGSMRNRARAYAQARGVELSATDLWIIEQNFSLMDDDDAVALAEVLATINPKLIIVDTLAAASGGGNENSGEDMNKVLMNCRKMHAATGALILLIHHSGKDASRGARGWSGLNAAVDAEYEIKSSPTSQIRVMTATKLRDESDNTQFPFKLLTIPLDFDDTTSCVIEPLDDMVIQDQSGDQLPSNQKLVFKAIHELSGESLQDNQSVLIQDIYTSVLGQMPAPLAGQRDRRPEAAKRAIEKLHEKGYITVANDTIFIGGSFDDQAANVPMSAM